MKEGAQSLEIFGYATELGWLNGFVPFALEPESLGQRITVSEHGPFPRE